MMKVISYNILINLVLIITIKECTGSCLGCLELDVLTFNKMVTKFEYTLAKFDIAFPYGEKHELYAGLARKYGPITDNLLIALVGIKDYGDKENSALGERYKINEKKYPAILLFRNYSTENWVKFSEYQDFTGENLEQFIRDNSNLYIGLDGRIKKFDKLTKNFLGLNKDEQSKILNSVNELREKLTNEQEKENAQIYIIMMNHIIEKGSSFVDEEKRRISNLLKGKISDKKRTELTHRKNVLESFNSIRNKSKNKKEEL